MLIECNVNYVVAFKRLIMGLGYGPRKRERERGGVGGKAEETVRNVSNEVKLKLF